MQNTEPKFDSPADRQKFVADNFDNIQKSGSKFETPNVNREELLNSVEKGEINIFKESDLRSFEAELIKADKGGSKIDFEKAQKDIDSLIRVNACVIEKGKVVSQEIVFVKKIETDAV